MSSSPSSFFTPASDFDPKAFEGATLVVPIVSAANVPQLAVDLVIATLPGLRRVGYLDSDKLIPFVGGPEAGSKDQSMVTALEVYGQSGDEDRGVYFVQQRSPVLNSHKSAFIAELVNWISGAKFEKMLLVSSLDASSRVDEMSSATKHHHLPLPSAISIPFPTLQSSVPAFTSVSTSAQDDYQPIETISSDPSTSTTATSGGSSAGPILPPLPGSGLLSSLLLSILQPEQGKAVLPIGVVLSFVVEGDNREDAKEVASLMDMVLDLGVGRAGSGGWREPESWDALQKA